jgi:hypothetical protein
MVYNSMVKMIKMVKLEGLKNHVKHGSYACVTFPLIDEKPQWYIKARVVRSSLWRRTTNHTTMPMTTRRAKSEAYRKMSNNQFATTFSESESGDDDYQEHSIQEYNGESSDEDDDDDATVTDMSRDIVPTPESYEQAVEETIDTCAATFLSHISDSLMNSKYEGVIVPSTVLRDTWSYSSHSPLLVWQAWNRTIHVLKEKGYDGEFSVNKKSHLCWHIYTKYESRLTQRIKKGVLKVLQFSLVMAVSVAVVSTVDNFINKKRQTTTDY